MNNPISSTQQSSHDATLLLVTDCLNGIHKDVIDLRESVRDSVKDIAVALNKLAAFEERQLNMSTAYDRLSKDFEKTLDKYEKLENRVDALEREQPDNQRIKDWIYKGIIGILGIVGLFVMKFVGLY